MKRILIAALAAVLCCGGLAYASGGGVHWGYSGEGAPAHWGDLAPAFVACKEGMKQSPIDITGAVDKDLPALELSYKNVPLQIINNGHAIQVNYKAGSQFVVEGKTYKLIQFHFHNPSENTINGEYFPLEAHLVHQAADGELAVIGVMFKLGKSNPLLEQVWDYMPSKAESTMSVFTKVNISAALPESLDYYTWSGSLTTPPCTEGVRWIVLKEAAEMSPAQVEKFKSTMGFANNRPVLPLNDRVIYQ